MNAILQMVAMCRTVIEPALVAAGLAFVGYVAHWGTGLDPAWSGLVTAVCAAALHAIRKHFPDAPSSEPESRNG